MRINKKRKIIASVCVFMILIIMVSIQVNAMSEDDLTAYFVKNKSFFTGNNIIVDALHWIGWILVKLLKNLGDLCQVLYRYSLGFMDFTQYSLLQEWIPTLKKVFIGIMILSIFYMGITLIINHKKQPQFFTALILAGLSVSASGYLLITINNAVYAFCDEVTTSTVPTDLIINSQLWDLDYIDRTKGLSSLNVNSADYLATAHYPIDNFDIDFIDINETLNYEDYTGDTKDILSSKIKFIMSQSGYSYEHKDVYNGFGWNSSGDSDWFNEFYYRYHVNFLSIYIVLIAYCIVYISVSYKTCRLTYEIVVHQIIAILFSADLGGAQKTIKIWSSIKDNYCVLMFSAISIKLFVFAELFLSEKYANDGLVYGLLSLFIAFAVADGPTIMQQLTGVDAGLQNGFSKMFAMYQVSKMATNAATTPIHRILNNGLLNKIQGNSKGKDNLDVGGERHGIEKESSHKENKDNLKTGNTENGKSNADSNKNQDTKQNLNVSNPENDNSDNVSANSEINTANTNENVNAVSNNDGGKLNNLSNALNGDYGKNITPSKPEDMKKKLSGMSDAAKQKNQQISSTPSTPKSLYKGDLLSDKLRKNPNDQAGNLPKTDLQNNQSQIQSKSNLGGSENKIDTLPKNVQQNNSKKMSISSPAMENSHINCENTNRLYRENASSSQSKTQNMVEDEKKVTKNTKQPE